MHMADVDAWIDSMVRMPFHIRLGFHHQPRMLKVDCANRPRSRQDWQMAEAWSTIAFPLSCGNADLLWRSILRSHVGFRGTGSSIPLHHRITRDEFLRHGNHHAWISLIDECALVVCLLRPDQEAGQSQTRFRETGLFSRPSARAQGQSERRLPRRRICPRSVSWRHDSCRHGIFSLADDFHPPKVRCPDPGSRRGRAAVRNGSGQAGPAGGRAGTC